MNDVRLIAEWIDYMDTYRLYDPRFPQQSVAFVDSIEEAYRPGYFIEVRGIDKSHDVKI